MGQSLQSQLVTSCQSDQVELCKSTLNQDLNLFNYEDDKSMNILLMCAKYESVGIIKMLFSDFKKQVMEIIDKTDWPSNYTALHWACYNQNLEIVKILVENGANTTIENSDGQKAINLCEKNSAIYSYLASDGASLFDWMKKTLQPNKYNHSNFKPSGNEDYVTTDTDDGFVEIEKVDVGPIPEKTKQEEQKITSKLQILENITKSFAKTFKIESTLSHDITSSVRFSKVNDMELMGAIASGSEGKVFYGRWKKQSVAIKVIDVPYLTEGLVENLNLILNISHKYCISHHSFSYDEENCKLYIIMELMNTNLFKYIFRQKKELTMKEIVNALYSISIGMFYLHDMNPPVLNLDLKLENILINIGNDGRISDIKICDFGLSMFKSKEEFIKLTDPVGTLRAIAPEILHNFTCSEKSDVYSFGILMYELLFGRVAYYDYLENADDNNGDDLLLNIVNNHKRPTIPSDFTLPTLNPERTSVETLIDMMQKCWVEDPKERPTFDHITTELEKISTTLK